MTSFSPPTHPTSSCCCPTARLHARLLQLPFFISYPKPNGSTTTKKLQKKAAGAALRPLHPGRVAPEREGAGAFMAGTRTDNLLFGLFVCARTRPKARATPTELRAVSR